MKYYYDDPTDDTHKISNTYSGVQSRRFNRMEIGDLTHHNIDDKKSTMTHQQYMDLVFSPADIIDMNDRYLFKCFLIPMV